MKHYTLISFVGTGAFKKDGGKEGYSEASYQFPNGTTYTTNIFLEALLKSGYRSIKKVILLGTRTSSWDVLLADIRSDSSSPDYGSLWSKIIDECESAGISDESAALLEEALSKKLCLPVAIKVHTPVIDAETIPEIFPIYNTLVSELAPETDILLDITHSFRSLPILVYQALQFGLTGLPPRNVELIYGEIRNNGLSPARDLSQYWQLSQITEAKNLFARRLDGKRLAQLLHDEWPQGEELISRFSTIVECNLALDIPKWLKDANRDLGRPLKGTEPEWVLEIRKIVQSEIVEKISPAKGNRSLKTSEVLRSFSALLEQHGLFIQAIITLQVALETRTIEAFGSPDDIGDYSAWHDIDGPNYQKNYQQKREALNVVHPLRDIESIRNAIAHGGYKKRWGSKASKGLSFTAQEIRDALKKSKEAVQIFFDNVRPKDSVVEGQVP
ncbi:putative crispr-associated protein, family [Treponema primitia ZAS-2]|uniref:Putative crispr-associated protein, family n=1 Tax=Treponema primitia (strain ATCC BAA-887 / DSM 12427 / ZAS-2) TaxID=545694 RepID=F5YHA6_TREPZ|nr:TIGR02221 family CRISPR-associated protein [Treponema primitia]AEF84098.1 putative crispr-associated protein, family [Treponema primitia ZAS-2]